MAKITEWRDGAMIEIDEPENLGVENTFLPLNQRQIRLGLLYAGRHPSTVAQVIDQLPEPQKSEAEVYWEYSPSYHRDHPLLVQVGHALGLTDEQMDAMWRAAQGL